LPRLLIEDDEETRFIRSDAAAVGAAAAVVASPMEMPPTGVSNPNKLLGESILRRSRDAIRRMPLTGDRR
jgi:hypothetical protein